MSGRPDRLGELPVVNRPLTPRTPERPRPSREEILALLRRKKPELEARFGVRSMGLFGSYAIGEATEQSDVDILVDVDPSIALSPKASSSRMSGRPMRWSAILRSSATRRADSPAPTGRPPVRCRGIRSSGCAIGLSTSILESIFNWCG